MCVYLLAEQGRSRLWCVVWYDTKETEGNDEAARHGHNRLICKGTDTWWRQRCEWTVSR